VARDPRGVRRYAPARIGGDCVDRAILRKTKIVATIGPASDEQTIIKEMIQAGMNVARLNFSHGTHDEHRRRLETIRAAASAAGWPVATLIDTRGPEIRTRRLEGGKAELERGAGFDLLPFDQLGNAHGVSVTHPSFFDHVVEGTRILVDDGSIELVAKDVLSDRVACEVVRGGTLGDLKGINVPDLRLPHEELTEQDRLDISFALEHGIDYVAASFVRGASDVHAIRALLAEAGAKVPIIAKIESREGVENLDEIIKAADGTMVARGDLGVEVPLQDVPIVQKQIIHKTVQNGKPVITATQMLDSMERNPTPTRAEVSDVANAIFDGTSAVMLSGETASGRYPVESVRTMSALAVRAEGSLDYYGHLQQHIEAAEEKVTDAVSHGAIGMAKRLGAAAIVTLTESGFTSRSISKFRPQCPILAVTPHEEVVRRLSMNWGVTGMRAPEGQSDTELLAFAIERGRELGFIQRGDLLVVTHGVERESGSTSMVRVLTVDR